MESTGRPPGLWEKGTIAVGADADVTIFNLNALIAKSQEVFISTPVEATHRDMVESLTTDTLRIAGANLNIAPYPV